MLKIEKMTEDALTEVLEISESQFGVNGWQIKLFMDELVQPNHFAYIAQYDEKVVGFLFVMKTEGVAGEELNILNIATRKGYENCGIATEMLSFLFKFAKELDIKNLWLEVRESNQKAIKLYKNLGFSLDYVRKKYYSGGENALIMSLKIG